MSPHSACVFEITCSLPLASESLPDAFTQAPCARMKVARQFVMQKGMVRQGFKGRVGLGIFEENGRTWGMLVLDP